MRITKVNQLVIIGYGVLTSLTLAAMVAGDRYLAAKDHAHQRSERSLALAEQLLAGSERLTSNVRAFAATGEQHYRDAYFNEVTVIRSRDEAIEGLSELDMTNTESDLIEAAKANSDRLIDLEKRAFAAGEEGNLPLAVELVYGPVYQSALASIYGPIDRFRELLATRLRTAGALAQRNADDAHRIAWASILLNILTVFSLLILFYRRRVVQPLCKLNEEVQGLLTGDHPVVISHQEDHSEIGDLARSFEAFRQLEKRIDRQRRNKRQATELSLALQAVHEPEHFTQVYLSHLADWLDVRLGVLHGLDDTGTALVRLGGYGLAADEMARRTPLGTGLAGQCALDKQPLSFAAPPPDYPRIASGTGSSAATALLIRPLLLNGQLLGVAELAAFRPFDAMDLELLDDLEQVLVMNLANLRHALILQSDTARIRASEASLEAILNGLSDGIFCIDRDGVARYINPSACQQLGYAASELLGQPIHALIHHTHPDGSPHPREACPMYQTLLDGQARVIDADVLWRKEGSPLGVRYRITPMLDQNARCTGSVIVFHPQNDPRGANP